jgi:hypothetical protein
MPEFYFDLDLTTQYVDEMIANLYLDASELGAVDSAADIPASYFEVGTLPPEDAGSESVSDMITFVPTGNETTPEAPTLESLQVQVVGLANEVAQLKIFMRWQLDAFNAAVQIQDVAITNEIIMAWVALRHQLRLDNLETELGIEFDANAIV